MAESKSRPVKPHVVVGAGIAGIKASLDIAETGRKVFLVERRPNIGGTLSKLDLQFPNNHCGMCRSLPGLSGGRVPQFCLRREMGHPNITLLTGAEVASVEGSAPDFKVSVLVRHSGVVQEKCISCGKCIDACPVSVPDEFSEGLAERKAIYVRHRLAVPNIPAIDFAACTRCGKCVEVCPTAAVKLEGKDETRVIEAASVVLSAGFEEFAPAPMGQYGHGRYKNVLSGIEFERLLCQATPGRGELKRPSDGKPARRIAFLQCVGSRDTAASYCSSACCMFALKEALMAAEMDPMARPEIFYMDFRAFGKGYYRYFLGAADRVKFFKGRVAAVRDVPGTGDLALFAAGKDGTISERRFDLVVLSTGFRPPEGSAELFSKLGIDAEKHGFAAVEPLDPVRTTRDGVYVCGPISQPRDIPDTMAAASAAAALAMTHSSAPGPEQGSVGGTGLKPQDTARIALVLCGCGGEVSSKVDLGSLAARAGGGFESVETVPVLCGRDTLDAVSAKLAASKANRVIFAACLPYRFTAMFRTAAEKAGIPSNFVDIVNLREHAAWVHEAEGAADKAGTMIRMAAARLASELPRQAVPAKTTPRVLIVGGGTAGMTAALTLADLGFESDLVEKTASPGGSAGSMVLHQTSADPAEFSRKLVEAVKANPAIRTWTSAQIASLEGWAGNFVAGIKRSDGTLEKVQCGSVVVATGGKRIEPSEYMYKRNERVLLKQDFDRLLVSGKAKGASSVAVIMCAGVRDASKPWCGRSCCSEMMATLRALKERLPDAAITVFYRDMMTFGFNEDFYRDARSAGAVFMRYEEGVKPQVAARGEKLVIKASDPVLDATVEVEADYLVLSSAFGPGDNAALAKILDVKLDRDGFFAEADVKFRPVDFMREGVFLAGLANCPQGLEERVTQGRAAAGRAAALLTRGTLESVAVTVAEVDARRCSGCQVCVAACPYDARVIDPETNVIVVREALCTGCGACAAACPNSAAKVAAFREKQVMSMIDAALGL